MKLGATGLHRNTEGIWVVPGGINRQIAVVANYCYPKEAALLPTSQSGGLGVVGSNPAAPTKYRLQPRLVWSHGCPKGAREQQTRSFRLNRGRLVGSIAGCCRGKAD